MEQVADTGEADLEVQKEAILRKLSRFSPEEQEELIKLIREKTTGFYPEHKDQSST